MDFGHKEKRETATVKPDRSARIREILILSMIAAILIVAVWKIFYTEKPQTTVSEAVYSAVLTDEERKISALISDMDGVGKAQVAICSDNGEVKKVVVVCEGAENFLVTANVREAVAAALDVKISCVYIYPMSGKSGGK